MEKKEIRPVDRLVRIGELAEMLKGLGVDTGQKRLFRYLREKGYLMREGIEKNRPTKKGLDLGLFKVINHPIAVTSQLTVTKSTTLVTPRGQHYFIEKFTSLQYA